MAGNPIFYEDIAQFSKLNEQFDILLDRYSELKKAVKDSAAELAKSQKATSELAKDAAELNKQYKTLTDAEKQALALKKELNSEGAKRAVQEQKEIQQAREHDAALKNQGKTYAELSAKLKALRQDYMSTEIGTAKFKELEKAIAGTQTKLKSMDADMNDHRRNVGNYTSALDKFKGGWLMVTGAIAGVVAASAGLIKIGKDVINSTDAMQDKWEEVTTGMKFSYDQFLLSIATGDWSNFFSNITNAYNAGVKYAKLLDEIVEKQLGYDIANAKDEERLKKLLILSRSRFNTEEQRIEYGRQYLELANKVAYREVDIAKDQIEKDRILVEQKTKLGYATVAAYLEARPYRKEEIEQAEKYLKAQKDIKELQKAGGYGADVAKELKAANETIRNTTEETKRFATVVEDVARLNGEEQAQTAKGIVGISQARQSYDDRTARAQILLSSLITKNGDMELKNAQKADDALNKRTDQTRELTRATEDYEREISKVNDIFNRIYSENPASMKAGGMGINTGVSAGAGPQKVDNPTPTFTSDIETSDAEIFSRKMAKISEYASFVEQAYGKITDIIRQADQQEMDEFNQKYDEQEKVLERSYKHKEITEKQYQIKKDALDKKRAQEGIELQRKQNKKKQEMDIISAIINTAVGVTGALAATPGPAGIVMAVLVGILGALEVATIASQKFAQGGFAEVTGKQGKILKGKRHSEGGVSLGALGTAEAGEWAGIINRNATAKYGDLLPEVFNSINSMRFEKAFAPVNIVNVDSKYQKKLYEHAIKPKQDKLVFTDRYGRTVMISGNQTTILN